MFRRSLGLIFCLTFAGAAPADEPTLRVGFAEVDITPELGDKPVWMAGFGQNRPAEGVLDPIMARAIVLTDGSSTVAIISADLVGLFLPTVENVRARLDGFDAVLVTATHNHEGPDTMGLWGPNFWTSGVDPNYLERVEVGLAEAARRASRNLGPVAARIGKASDPKLLHDTREPIVLHDEIVALRFDDPETGSPRGVLVQWNCHPETLGNRNQRLSADFVAYTVKELRERFDCPVVYLTGTVGGLMTTLGLEVRSESGAVLPAGSVEKTERYGRLVGRLAASALEKSGPIRLAPIEVRTRKLLLPIDNKLYRLAWQIGVLKRDAFSWNGDPFEDEPALSEDLSRPMAVRSEVGYWRLGDLGVAVIPGEIYPELVLGKVPDPAPEGADFPDAPVEPDIYGRMPTRHKMIVGLGNDELGYILPKRQWDEKPPFTYGAAKAPYGEENSLGPETGPIICEAFRRLTRE